MVPLVMVTRRGMAEIWGGVDWLCLNGGVGHRLVSAERQHVLPGTIYM